MAWADLVKSSNYCSVQFLSRPAKQRMVCPQPILCVNQKRTRQVLFKWCAKCGGWYLGWVNGKNTLIQKLKTAASIHGCSSMSMN